MNKLFITLKEYQGLSGRSSASALRDVKAGRVPHVRIGHTILIPASYLSELERSAYSVVTNQGASTNQGGQ